MSRIDEIEAELAELRGHQEKLHEEWQSLKGRQFSREMNKLFPEGITLEGIFKVDWEILGNSDYAQDWWDKIIGWLDVQQHGTYNEDTGQYEGAAPLRGVYRDSYNPDTNQVAFTIVLDQRRPLDEQLGLLAILPLTRAHHGWKVFRILKHDCGESGNFWALRVSEDEKVGEVWNTRDLRYAGESSWRKAEFKGTVKEALEHVLRHHPYELASRDCDDY
jgi:hypothetical protein